MGAPMAVNLAKRNPVLGFDSNESTRRRMQAEMQVVEHLTDVLSAQIILTMLPNTDSCLSAYLGDKGLLSEAKKDQLFIDCSTIDPTASRRISSECEKCNVKFIDAPVSGGTPGAKAATLTFMAGGSIEALQQAEAILLQMGRRVFHVGPVGSGGAAKLCNNLMASINLVGTSEVMGLGMRLGLKPEVLLRVLNLSSGMNWATESYCPIEGIVDGLPSSDNFEDGFACELMLKDINLAQKVAHEANAPLMLGSITQSLYRLLCERGYSRKDSAIVSAFFTSGKFTSLGGPNSSAGK
ncbi:3-hydroxyisobutyrate dehydrogenase, mitochondrial [Galendromus occidentalis]|uniref:3-hydroxyisobutyrate dehydrogenase n=1 Tax=Galendromus occidentalis TaxID=34638 RepID=A0AAJ6QXH7_9ACAR|nr:3-hydroxyisobutyrate dehydrogenase, mitochondrial [Galendromus occidentalis]